MEDIKTKKDMAKLLVDKNVDSLSKEELINLILDETVGIDVDKEYELNKNKSQRLADNVTRFLGTWKFIASFLLFLIVWIILNVYFIKIDPYPFILLNLLLSCITALQAPIIMMSQNIEAKKESNRNQNDYKIDLKSELILEVLYEQMEEIICNQKKLSKVLKNVTK